VSRNWSARPVLPTLGLTQWWTKNGPRGGRGQNPARAVDFQHNHLMFHVKNFRFSFFRLLKTKLKVWLELLHFFKRPPSQKICPFLVKRKVYKSSNYDVTNFKNIFYLPSHLLVLRFSQRQKIRHFLFRSQDWVCL